MRECLNVSVSVSVRDQKTELNQIQNKIDRHIEM